LELTATPIVETGKGRVFFKNVIFDYPLARAMEDGFVKEPAVVTQKNFEPQQFTPLQLEEIKLQDGIRLHENTKVELETYARQTGQPIVKPFMLIIARDTTHAAQLKQFIESEKFFDGRYSERVIQVDSTTKEDELIERLLKVESPDEPTEIVIHVNMLKEGWDVTNLYTIVPLRAANARVLIEQSIGRGLRLPYGRRTGVIAVDRLSIVAHDRFQEIIDEANRPDSAIRLQQVILDPTADLQRMRTVVSQSNLATQLTGLPPQAGVSGAPAPPAFADDAERKIAELAYRTMRQYETLPTSSCLLTPELQQTITEKVMEAAAPWQPALPGVSKPPDIAAVVAKTAELIVRQTIDIPRIVVVPTGEVAVGFNPFDLDCAGIRYQPVERDLLIQHLRTHEQETLSLAAAWGQEQRLEDYVVRGLIDFDDISYDDHADLLYSLAGQLVGHLRSYLSEEAARNVLIYHQKQLAAFVHVQMQAHQWEKATGYEVKVNKGFTELKESAYTARADEPVHDFRQTVEDKSRIAQIVFGGFQRCLYPLQKFQSDSERKLAVILDREALKWFKPAKGQFQIYYKAGTEQPEYVPDFVAETETCIYMLEAKARNEMTDGDVQAKKDAATAWCCHAGNHATSNGGTAWKYLLVPHDAIAANMTLAGLASQFREQEHDRSNTRSPLLVG
jgi:type III restriction enzyme